MAVPPYLTQRMQAYYAATGDAEALGQQQCSDAQAEQALAPYRIQTIFQQIYSEPPEGPPNRKLHFYKKIFEDTATFQIRAQVSQFVPSSSQELILGDLGPHQIFVIGESSSSPIPLSNLSTFQQERIIREQGLQSYLINTPPEAHQIERVTALYINSQRSLDHPPPIHLASSPWR